jgi:DNA polymerase-3 subunit beta
MKIQIDAEELNRAFSVAAHSIGAGSGAQTINHVQISTTGHGCELWGTNGTTSICSKVNPENATVQNSDGPQKKLVLGRRFHGIIRESKDIVTLTATAKNPDTMVIKSGSSRTQLKSKANEKQFVTLKKKPHADACLIVAEELQRAFSLLRLAISKEGGRWAINGIRIEFDRKNKRIDLVSTTGSSMMHIQLPAPDLRFHAQAILPKEAIRAIGAFEKTEQVRVHAGANLISFESDCTSVYSVLVDGKFPKWTTIMPKAKDAEFDYEFNRDELLSGIGQAAIVGTREEMGMFFDFQKDMVSLSMSGEHGATRCEVSYQGEPSSETPRRMKFDNRFLKEFLKRIKSDSVQMYLYGPENPVTLEADGVRYVIAGLA